MFIDTHCHLDFDKYDGIREAVIERAERSGVGMIINVGSSLEGSRRAVDLASRHAAIYASVGVHPHDAGALTDDAMKELERLAVNEKVVAIGETGLDFYRNLAPRDLQEAAFRKQIALALRFDKPLIIHSRDAGSDTLSMLISAGSGKVRGVMHCFSGDASFLKLCLDAGLYISFTCNLTFKNARELREVAKLVPPERLLLETDAPYLAPEGQRGKTNEPVSVIRLAEELSGLLSLSVSDIERITTQNAVTLFALPFASPQMIAYPIRDSLYLNITNRCTADCSFCIRQFTDVVKGHNLRLEREPDAEEVLSAAADPSRYREVVFCGYGEPTLRLELLKKVARSLKEKGARRIRLNTNGHGDLISGRSIAPELKGLVDTVSVSLNAASSDAYVKLCRPSFGPSAFDAVLAFIRSCGAQGIETEVTCLDVQGADSEGCKKIAREIGARFRERKTGVVG